MAVNDELARFVRDGLASGATRGSIGEVLRGAGWAAGDVRGALASYGEVEFPIPVPRPQAYLSARDGFMYLLLCATLVDLHDAVCRRRGAHWRCGEPGLQPAGR